jgi:excisionase family DNA binding protein
MIPEIGDRELVDILRAADICGVSRRTIYNWLAANKIEGVRTAGGCIRIFADTLFREIGEIKTNQERKTNGRIA